MRNVVVWNLISLDGFFEGPNKNVMALPLDEAFDAYSAQRMEAAGTILLGRRTYEAFREFWPPLAADESETPAHRTVSRCLNELPKVVVSDSLTLSASDTWADTTEVVSRAEAEARVLDLKNDGDGGDILVAGSRTLWNSLLDQGLVDELHLMIGAIVLGEGTTAFQTGPSGSLRLRDLQQMHGSGNFVAHYTVSERSSA
jgi:dihydrofolate reductase